MTEILVVEDQMVGIVTGPNQVLTVIDPGAVLVTINEDGNQVVLIESGEPQQLEVVETPGEVVQVAVIESGPQGKPGMDTADLSFEAAEAIGGQRVVATDEQGMAVYADNLTRYKTVVGISTGAAVQGAVVTVKPFGRLKDSSWNWNPCKGLFLGQNGVVVQDAPSTGAIVPLGFVMTPTRIFISIGSRIERE